MRVALPPACFASLLLGAQLPPAGEEAQWCAARCEQRWGTPTCKACLLLDRRERGKAGEAHLEPLPQRARHVAGHNPPTQAPAATAAMAAPRPWRLAGSSTSSMSSRRDSTGGTAMTSGDPCPPPARPPVAAPLHPRCSLLPLLQMLSASSCYALLLHFFSLVLVLPLAVVVNYCAGPCRACACMLSTSRELRVCC